jgi:hypothetical protein
LHSGLSDRVKGMVFSDQNGTIYIEQSADGGANWDVSTSYAITGGDGSGFSEELVGPVFRVRFVPAVDTTEFRISVNTSSAGPR